MPNNLITNKMKKPIVITTTFQKTTPRSCSMIVVSNHSLPHNFEEKLQRFIMSELEAELQLQSTLTDAETFMNESEEAEGHE